MQGSGVSTIGTGQGFHLIDALFYIIYLIYFVRQYTLDILGHQVNQHSDRGGVRASFWCSFERFCLALKSDEFQRKG